MLLSWFSGCTPIHGSGDATISPAGLTVQFTELTAAAGIRHRHFKPILDHKLDNIMSWVCSVGAAAAAGDYNHDGWIDLYVTARDCGPGTLQGGIGGRNALICASHGGLLLRRELPRGHAVSRRVAGDRAVRRGGASPVRNPLQ